VLWGVRKKTFCPLTRKRNMYKKRGKTSHRELEQGKGGANKLKAVMGL